MKIIEGKGEIARNEQFLLFPQCFFSDRIGKLSSILSTSKIVVCKLFQFETVQNLSPEVVNPFPDKS